MKKENYFIFTGAMGAGKSTTINLAAYAGINTIKEPAREILKEQRAIHANGVPEISPELFVQLMLSRATQQYLNENNKNSIVLFDRGIPDQIAYAQLFGLDLTIYRNAAENYRYNNTVFYFDTWEDIYQNDEERKMTFKQAKEFGALVLQNYSTLGYHIIKISNSTPQDRILEVFNHII